MNQTRWLGLVIALASGCSSPPDRLSLDSFVLAKQFDLDGRSAYTTVAEAGIVYVAIQEGFGVYRISHGDDAEELTRFTLQPATAQQFQPLAIRDHILAMAQGSRIFLCDVSNPAVPVQLAAVDIGTSSATTLAFDDHYLYYSSLNTMRIDVADPAHPSAPQILSSQNYQQFVMRDHRIYASATNGFSIFDLPARPNQGIVPIGHVDVVRAQALAFHGDLVYGVISSSGLLEVIDVSDVTAPKVVQAPPSVDVGGRGLMIRGDQLLVPTLADLTIDYDISDPRTPREVDAKVIPRNFERSSNYDGVLVDDIAVFANQRGVLVLTPTL